MVFQKVSAQCCHTIGKDTVKVITLLSVSNILYFTEILKRHALWSKFRQSQCQERPAVPGTNSFEEFAKIATLVL